MFKNFLKFLLYFLFIINFTYIFAQSKTEIRQDEAFNLIFSDNTKAKDVIDSLIKSNENTPYQAKNYSLKGVYHGVRNELDSATMNFEKGLELISVDDPYYTNILTNLATAKKKQAKYNEALEILMEALEVAKLSKNLDGITRAYSEISSAYRGLNNYNLAVEYSLKSLENEHIKEIPSESNIAFEKQKLANLYRILGDFEFAKNLYEEILPFIENSQYIDAKIATYTNYAISLIKLNDLDKAEEYLEKADNELNEIENKELQAFQYYAKAILYKKNKNYEQTKKHYEKSLYAFQSAQDNYLSILNEYMSFLIDRKYYREVIEISSKHYFDDLANLGIVDFVEYNANLGKANEKLGNYKEAANYYLKTIDLKDSLAKQENFEIAKDLQSKYQNEIITQRNLHLQEQLKSENNKKLLVYTLALLLLFILTSLIFIYKYKLRNESKISTTLKEKLESEKQVIQLKEALLKEQKKEILSKSMDNMSLEKKLISIKNKIPNIDKSLSDEIMSFEKLVSPKNEYKKIMYEFERLYPEFKTDILAVYPKLTSSDIAFLSLIKLKFTFKEIAQVLGITHQSVITKKYRITKKMELDSEIDMNDYITLDRYKKS